MKVGLYVTPRCPGLTVEEQLQELMGWCVACEHDGVVYLEAAPEGATPVRSRLWANVAAEELEAVAVCRLSVLADDPWGLVTLLLEAEAHGVNVVGLADTWTQASETIRASVLSFLQELLRLDEERHRAATLAGVAAARARGARIGRPRANRVLLGAGARHHQEGLTVPQAARAAGVSVSTLRRYLGKLGKLAAPEPGPSGEPPPHSEKRGRRSSRRRG